MIFSRNLNQTSDKNRRKLLIDRIDEAAKEFLRETLRILPKPDIIKTSAIRKKIVVIGDKNCGKTCLLFVFNKGTFPKVFIPNAFEEYTLIKVDGKMVELAVWDIAGDENTSRLKSSSYENADVILICYSIDCHESLQNVFAKWTPEVRHFCPHVPIILVGNKMDLRNNITTAGKLVTVDEGNFAATSIGAIDFLECSSRNNYGVQKVFETVTKAALKAGPSSFDINCDKMFDSVQYLEEVSKTPQSDARYLTTKQTVRDNIGSQWEFKDTNFDAMKQSSGESNINQKYIKKSKRKRQHSSFDEEHQNKKKPVSEEGLVKTGLRPIVFDGSNIAVDIILQLAEKSGGVVISNDKYADILKTKKYVDVIKSRTVQFRFRKNIFLLPPDPLGRYKNKLDQILRF